MREVVKLGASFNRVPMWIRYVNRIFWELLRFTLPLVPFCSCSSGSSDGAGRRSGFVPVFLFGVVPALDFGVIAAPLCVRLVSNGP